MNYNNSELISVLSAEYVIGTLRGKARDRFETLKFNNPKINESVEYWQVQLHDMSLQVLPIDPSDKVWSSICSRLGFENSSTLSGDSSVVPINQQAPRDIESKTKSTPTNTPWKWVSGVALAASIIMALVLVKMEHQVIQPVESVAVFYNADSQAMWSIDILNEYLNVKATQNVPIMAANDYQLWMVPESGQAPISLGLLDQRGEYQLIKPEIFDQIDIAALAISKEPLGGSPTGAPTEVLFATEIAHL